MLQDNSLLSALKQFEATEANLANLERLWSELYPLIPDGICFGGNPDYEDKCRCFDDILAALPAIGGWKPEILLMELDEIAQNRLDAKEIGEIECEISVERRIEEPGKQLAEYRFQFNRKRRQLTRSAILSLIDEVDTLIREIRKSLDEDLPSDTLMTGAEWESLGEKFQQLTTLLGSSIPRPPRWDYFSRHLSFGMKGDFDDIEQHDWPEAKAGLRKSLYDKNEAIPVSVQDLDEVISAKPSGPIPTRLAWENISAEEFERLIYSLISSEKEYENPEWLMHTNAADRGRDLSVIRVRTDALSGTERQRVLIQCKHWKEKGISLSDIKTLEGQVSLWEPPRVDILIICSSGRFTQDAVAYIEKHNQGNNALKIEMWPESHLERLLAQRPHLIASFNLR